MSCLSSYIPAEPIEYGSHSLFPLITSDSIFSPQHPGFCINHFVDEVTKSLAVSMLPSPVVTPWSLPYQTTMSTFHSWLFLETLNILDSNDLLTIFLSRVSLPLAVCSIWVSFSFAYPLHVGIPQVSILELLPSLFDMVSLWFYLVSVLLHPWLLDICS